MVENAKRRATIEVGIGEWKCRSITGQDLSSRNPRGDSCIAHFLDRFHTENLKHWGRPGEVPDRATGATAHIQKCTELIVRGQSGEERAGDKVLILRIEGEGAVVRGRNLSVIEALLFERVIWHHIEVLRTRSLERLCFTAWLSPKTG
jgi:hypothetical protein